MKLINRKRKLIFEFEDKDTGILVSTKVKGNLKLKDILCAKEVIDSRLKDNGKNKRK